MSAASELHIYTTRRGLVLALFVMAMGALLARAGFLQIYERDFLQGQGDSRQQRVMSIPAHRGMIMDRNGEPLAISTPVDSVWANPQETLLAREQLSAVAKLLKINREDLYERLAQRADKQFVYLQRRVNPDIARQVMALNVPGVNLQREYRRYYPLGEVAAHVLGFTNIDDSGLEGLELAYNDWLSGEPGSKRVLRDQLDRVVEDIERLRAARPGKDLTLSIDRRIQYLAYRELKAAVLQHGARSGSIVVVDPKTGEILAMANQPAFNPNNRKTLRSSHYRNRAVTDVFEPGSTIKPFTVAAGIGAGKFKPETVINTSPGYYMVSGHTVQDEHDYGKINLSRVILKSSNVGASKIALGVTPKQLWQAYRDVGFGEITGSGFPGESAGLLSDYRRWRKIERATLSFGYGLSVTPLQLAQAYTVIANDGVLTSLSYTHNNPHVTSSRAMNATTAKTLRRMLHGVTGDEGTGRRARIEGYSVAGKTGTAHKSTVGGYDEDRYVSVFAGMAPVEQPRLVTVVMINEPSNGDHSGGKVAAPVFSRVMSGALRLLNVPPDNLPTLQANTPEPEAGAA